MTRIQDTESSDFVPIPDPAANNGEFVAEHYDEAQPEDQSPNTFGADGGSDGWDEGRVEGESEGQWLRRQRNTALQQAEQYRGIVIDSHLERLGLNPNAGLGIAARESLQKTTGPVSEESVAAHLKTEYRYEPEEGW